MLICTQLGVYNKNSNITGVGLVPGIGRVDLLYRKNDLRLYNFKVQDQRSCADFFFLFLGGGRGKT